VVPVLSVPVGAALPVKARVWPGVAGVVEVTVAVVLEETLGVDSVEVGVEVGVDVGVDSGEAEWLDGDSAPELELFSAVGHTKTLVMTIPTDATAKAPLILPLCE
jgi:hypothetical protein